MKINYCLLVILTLAGSLLEGSDNAAKGIHKKHRSKFSQLSPEQRADVIKTLREIYGAIQRLDQKLAQFEESLLALDSHITKNYHKKRS